jgi:hypothetical protein
MEIDAGLDEAGFDARDFEGVRAHRADAVVAPRFEQAVPQIERPRRFDPDLVA